MTATTLDGLGRELDQLTAGVYDSLSPSNMRQVAMAAGMAAKDGGNRALVQRLGPDRAMSNMRTRSGRLKTLGLGFDIADTGKQVAVNHRPAGLWALADQGRKKSGPIFPLVNNRRARGPSRGNALLFPDGEWRATGRYVPSRGTGVFQLAAGNERDDASKAAAERLFAILAAAVGVGWSVGR